MKWFLLLSFLYLSLAACQGDRLVRSCDCELDFTILVRETETKETDESSPSWEIGGEKGKNSGISGGANSGESSESTQWEKERLTPFSTEGQKPLALIAAFYKKKCLNLCSDPNLSDQEFRERMRELNDEAEQKSWESLNAEDRKRILEPSSGNLPKIKTYNSCLSEEGMDWKGSVLTFRYECPDAGRNFRLVATAMLFNGTKETNPNFLKGSKNSRTGIVQFDLSKLNWKYLSQQEMSELKLLEARISIPVKGGEEKAVATIFFEVD